MLLNIYLMKRFLLLLSLLQTTLIASAYDIKVDGLCYNFTSDSTVAVTYLDLNDNAEYVKDIIDIPATIDYEGRTYIVTSIGKHAFTNCSLLKRTNLPSSLVTIEDYAFEKCSQLVTAWIPEGVKEVGAAFCDCSLLLGLVIPSTATKIDTHIITNCQGLNLVACRATTPPVFSNDSIGDAFVANKCKLRVPKESIEAYQSASGWNKFKDYDELPPAYRISPTSSSVPMIINPPADNRPLTAITDKSEYLTLSTYDPSKWTYEDNVIVQKALNRMTIISENGMSFVKDMKASDLNMSEELFNFIKKGFKDGNTLMEEGKSKNGF